MLQETISKLLQYAVEEAQRRGVLPQVGVPEVAVEHPQNPDHGDYASSLPLKLARSARTSPMDIAETVVRFIAPVPEVGKVDVAPPGFINLTLAGEWLAQQVEVVLAQGEWYGDTGSGRGTRVQLEFVSVNPTGPLHVGHGRGAVLGGTLANVLKAAGYSVEKEYYVNDAGNQMTSFYRSLYARYQQELGHAAELPADGYRGEYVVDLAREIVAEVDGGLLELPEEVALDRIGRMGLRKAQDSIRRDLDLLGVTFDVWFSEQSLYDSGQFQRTMALLRQNGFVVDKEGAVWFASSEMGEDKDNVLVRSNGTPTYFASDIAYHRNKFSERGFDRVIDIWGADHQGHVPRMKAAVQALGIDPARLEIIITQMVSLRRGDVELKVSKRSGELVTLRELVEEVGADACKFFFLSRSADSQMDFDLELAKRESSENPVYYVQYAHARIASILRVAEERGVRYENGDVTLLVDPAELALIRKMIQLEEVIELVAGTLQPHHLPYYAQNLATAFHSFYKQCRVISDDPALTAARMKLVEASRVVFARALHLMGMSAPERM